MDQATRKSYLDSLVPEGARVIALRPAQEGPGRPCSTCPTSKIAVEPLARDHRSRALIGSERFGSSKNDFPEVARR